VRRKGTRMGEKLHAVGRRQKRWETQWENECLATARKERRVTSHERKGPAFSETKQRRSQNTLKPGLHTSSAHRSSSTCPHIYNIARPNF